MSVAWSVGAWATDSWVGMNGGPPNAWRGDSTPTPSTDTGGGAGHPVYARRRKWRELRNVIDEGLQAVYQELAAAGLPVDVMGEAVKIVKPFADKRARFRSTVKPSEVDWAALQRDAELSRRLLEIYEQHVGEQAWARMLEEEDEILLLN